MTTSESTSPQSERSPWAYEGAITPSCSDDEDGYSTMCQCGYTNLLCRCPPPNLSTPTRNPSLIRKDYGVISVPAVEVVTRSDFENEQALLKSRLQKSELLFQREQEKLTIEASNVSEYMKLVQYQEELRKNHTV